MILDLSSKTVSFPAGGTLTLSQLWGLIDILDDDIDSEVNRMLRSVSEDTPLVEPISYQRQKYSDILGIYERWSDTREYRYVIVFFSHGDPACSCPDWVYRKSKTGAYCKHIDDVRRIGVILCNRHGR